MNSSVNATKCLLIRSSVVWYSTERATVPSSLETVAEDNTMRISYFHTISLLTCIVVAVCIPLVSACFSFSWENHEWKNPSLEYADDWDAHELVCGTESSNGKIVLGDDVDSVKTWPWLGRLTIDKGSEDPDICSAEIVAKRFVTTAAHCVTRNNGEMVGPEALTLKFNTNKHNVGGFTRKVEIMFRHHDYVHSTSIPDNDIVILKLFDNEPLVYSSSVRPVCLPKPDEDYLLSNCWAVGWGKTETGNVAVTLQELKMQLLTLSDCNSRLANAGWSTLSDDNICAEDADGMGGHVWGGDSGGPLMCKHDSQRSDWILIGISSFGSQGFQPDGFARVAKFSQWISDCFNEYGGPGPF